MFYNIYKNDINSEKTIMKVINNFSSVTSNFLCEGHCTFSVLFFFFVIFDTRRRKVSKMRLGFYAKIEMRPSKRRLISTSRIFMKA